MSGPAQFQQQIRAVLMERFTRDNESRHEAITEFFSVTAPSMPRSHAEDMATRIPPLLPALYEKWIFLFAKRLFETVPMEQIEHLCDNTPENNASLTLTFIMFLESERMEKQIEEDMATYGLNDDGQQAANYIRDSFTKIGEQMQEEKMKKAEEYKEKKIQ